MKNIKPTFLGIGVQKAGTTWLHYQLKKSEKVWLPQGKELHFFDRAERYPTPSNFTNEKLFKRLIDPVDRKRILGGIRRLVRALFRFDYERVRWIYKMTLCNYNYRWYQSLFRLNGNFMACGEIAPSYHIVDNYEIKQMFQMNPGLRLILLIRNPIDRDWSAIRFRAAKGVDRVNFEDYDQVISILNKPVYLEHSDYIKAIRKFNEVFPKEQLLICFYDAISQDPYNLLKDIYNHIGLSEDEIHEDEMKRLHNPSIAREIPEPIYNHLNARYTNQIKELSRMLGSYARIWAGEKLEANEIRPSVKVNSFD